MAVFIPGMYGGGASDPTFLITRRIAALGYKGKVDTLFITPQSPVVRVLITQLYRSTCLIRALPTNADKIAIT